MVNVSVGISGNSGIVFDAEEGAQEGTGSIGTIAMRRVKRDGRNPSTGARTSRRYGLTIIHLTGIPPLYGAYGSAS